MTVKDAGGTTLKSYAYDGLHRRVQKTASGVTTDLNYSDAWQVLEERVGGQVKAQYVWSPVYVDALVLRDRDTNGDGTLDERLYVVQDANYNVMALFDNAGNIVERYAYDPFGQVTILDAGWNVLTASAFGWLYLHQGGRFDATSGLYHFRHRDYSPTLGRWTRLDPIRYAAGDVNLYRTVFNAPTIYTDPSGQIIPLLIIGGAALVGGGWLVGEAMYHSHQTSGTLFDREIWGAALSGFGEGAMATVDGIVPFADPFAYYGMYDPNDPVLQFSQTMGQVARDLLLIALIPNITTWIRNPFLYEVGSTTVPPRIWQAIQGMSVVDRGRHLWQVFGWRSLFLSASAPSQFCTTIWSGLTPGGWLGLLAGVEIVDYFWETPLER